jgi:two-component system cell cycle sensor histidine kinase/response regulator CckA
MAHGFVEQSGGRVDVSSRPGVGTTFRILLPLARPEAEPARPAGAAQPERSGPATILVVDDESVLRQVAHRTLTARGYIVLLAGSGEEALAIATAYDGRIDLLFSDVVMPGLRGPGLAAALLRSRPDIRVLLTSGYAEDVIGRKGIESTAGEFLPKPYTPSMLAAAVEQLLSAESR